LNVVDIVDRLLRPIRMQLVQMLLKGITLRVNYDKDLPLLQVLVDGDPTEDIEFYENYGHAAHPLPGSQPLLAALGANRRHAVAAGVTDHRYRLKDLLPGETAIYSWKGGKLHFRNDNVVELSMPGGTIHAIAPNVHIQATTKVLLTTPLVECTQNLKVGGNLEVLGNTTLEGTLDVAGDAWFVGIVDVAGEIATAADVVIQGRGQLLHVHQQWSSVHFVEPQA
jgi:phage baseplate assembly protein V